MRLVNRIHRPAHPITAALAGRAVLVLLLSLGCEGTSPLFDPVHALNMREAGSVYVTVLAVAPWSEYVQVLQPKFDLSAKNALLEVVRDSLWQGRDERSGAGAGTEPVVIDPLQPSQNLQQPQVNLNNDSGPMGRTDGLFGYPDRRGPPNESPQQAFTGTDSMLRYTAAAALFQEVKLLEAYVRDAAIPAGYRPYLVRLQVSLMPSRRHAPYDAYTTLSFFIPGEHEPRPMPAAGWARTNTDAIFEEPFGNGPKVLSLVVTDNLEASVQSRSFDRVRALMASILDFQKVIPDAMQMDTNPALSFVEPMYSSLLYGALREEIFGRDLNSLFTVARLSENTLRIRLGANQEATANYAMVPRNHNVTLLLMVPEGAPPLMEVVSKTQLVDANTGEALAVTEEGVVRRALDEIRIKWGLDGFEMTDIEQLHYLARRNDQVSFSSFLRVRVPSDHSALLQERSLWIELVSLPLDDQYTSNLFELPGQDEDLAGSSELFRSQTVMLYDNGYTATITLREARFADYHKILAVLSGTGSGVPMLLPAAHVDLDLTKRELTLTFPSPKRWGLLPEEGYEAMELRLKWAGEEQVFQVNSYTLSGPLDLSDT